MRGSSGAASGIWCGPGRPILRAMEPQVMPVELALGERPVTAQLTLNRTEDWNGRGALLTLVCDLGEWTGLGPDIFSALRALMGDLERVHGRVGLVGARPNAWASGMQRDMGDGRSVYLLSLPRSPGRPPSAPTLDPAPLADVGTIADQDAFQRQWMPKPEAP